MHRFNIDEDICKNGVDSSSKKPKNFVSDNWQASAYSMSGNPNPNIKIGQTRAIQMPLTATQL